jgi:hypothetical protein
MQVRTRIGSWNVRIFFQKGKLAQLNRDMDRYKLDILGASKVRWNGSGQIMTTVGKMFLYSGMLNEEDPPMFFLINTPKMLYWNEILFLRG